MRYYLGLDGGGTKTAACILDEKRRELGRGQAGPCNIATGTPESLSESITTATYQALESAGLPYDTRFEAVCAGVAGYTAKRRRTEFRQLLAESIPATRHRLEPDFVIAYWGATEGEPGIIVSAGTGAVVYGRNEKGEPRREDGNGFLLGDEGSGFSIGRQALIHTLEQVRAGATSSFAGAILNEIGAEDVDDIIEWVYRDFSPTRIASLARVVLRFADEGDQTAMEHIFRAARQLRGSTQRVISDLGMHARVRIYALGGIWTESVVFARAFCKGSPVREQTWSWPEITLCDPRHDAAYGAALLGMQADGDA